MIVICFITGLLLVGISSYHLGYSKGKDGLPKVKPKNPIGFHK